MPANQWLERDDPLHASKAPHLSHSRVSRYLLCPEQYRLYYVENLHPRYPSANLAFGQALHQALAQGFRGAGEPVAHFREAWQVIREVPLAYGARDSWERLLGVGEGLLQKFEAEERPRLGALRAIEKPFELDITSLDLPFVGIIDLVAELEAKPTVIDFKTSATAHEAHEVVLADQLTAYQLAEPQTEQAAFCVLIKTKTPKIEWHVATRGPAQLTEYLAKVGYVGREIASHHFYKRPGKWCSWCDYLPVCLGDTARVRKTLVQIE